MRNILRFLFVVIAAVAPTLYAKDQQLVFAIDIIRHGDRTPETIIPNHPYAWKEGLGELTALGMMQTFDLGTEARKMYVEKEHLLPASYQAGSIYVRSSDFNRTLMSAQSFLYGLYPLQTGPLLNGQTPALPYAFQPVPIHTIARQEDCVLNPACGSHILFGLAEHYVYSTQEWKNKTIAYADKLKEWSGVTGLPMDRLNQVVKLGDNLYIRGVHGIPLPLGMSKSDSDDIQQLAQWVATRIFYPAEIGQHGSRELLSAIAQYLTDATQEHAQLKYVLFSAHDSTLMSLMSAFHHPLSVIPRYASNLKLLLFRTHHAYQLKVIFNGTTIRLPFCQQQDCTVQEFMTFAEKANATMS